MATGSKSRMRTTIYRRSATRSPDEHSDPQQFECDRTLADDSNSIPPLMLASWTFINCNCLSAKIKISHVTTRRRLRSSSIPTNSLCRHTACLQSERGPSRSPVPTSGTVCRRMWPPLHHCRCSDNARRQFCSTAAIRTYVLSELCFSLSDSGPSSIFHT